MNKLLTALVAIAIIFTSCQKEVKGDIGGSTVEAGSLLIKSVAVSGSDSLVTLYNYDNQYRLEEIIVDGISNGEQAHTYKKFERDATGRIIRTMQTAVQGQQTVDTIYDNFHYPNSSAMEFDYDLSNIDFSGFSVLDSNAYVYSPAKQLQKLIVYISTASLGGIYIPVSNIDFAYDGSGRVSTMKVYTNGGIPGTPMSQVGEESYTYSTGLNYLWASSSPAQNFILGGLPNAVNSAIANMQVKDLTDPTSSSNATVTYDYVVGSNNRPSSATATTTSSAGTMVTKYTFYYK